MAPPKPNAFSIFVQQRCKATGIAYAAGFQKFGAEWKLMDETARSPYKTEATTLKAVAAETKRVESLSPPKKHLLLPKKRDRLCECDTTRKSDVPREDGQIETDSDDCYDDRDEMDLNVSSSSSSSGTGARTIKRIYLGDEMGLEEDDVKYMVCEEEEDQTAPAHLTFDDDPTTDRESFINIAWSYSNLPVAELKKQTIFSFSCVPVIYAAGYKKGQTLPLNIPLEIAITFCSLQDGLDLQDYVHIYVDPGPLPPGSYCDADESRKDRHGLPHCLDGIQADCTFFHDNQLDSNYLAIYRRILAFVGFDGSSSDQLLPLACRRADLSVNEACMKWLHYQALKQAREKCSIADRNLPEFRFGALEDVSKLVLTEPLMAPTSPVTPVPCYTDKFIQLAFSHEFYKQLHTLNCKYHRKAVSVKNCALGASREGCYSLLHQLMKPFQLDEDDSRFVYRPTGQADSDSEM